MFSAQCLQSESEHCLLVYSLWKAHVFHAIRGKRTSLRVHGCFCVAATNPSNTGFCSFKRTSNQTKQTPQDVTHENPLSSADSFGRRCRSINKKTVSPLRLGTCQQSILLLKLILYCTAKMPRQDPGAACASDRPCSCRNCEAKVPWSCTTSGRC